MPLDNRALHFVLIFIERERQLSIDILFKGMNEMMTSLGGGRWQCVECGYQSKSTNVKYHIEAKHMSHTERYACQLCQELFSAKKNLQNHMQRKHREAAANPSLNYALL